MLILKTSEVKFKFVKESQISWGTLQQQKCIMEWFHTVGSFVIYLFNYIDKTEPNGLLWKEAIVTYG
jgi:hypothetical protein